MPDYVALFRGINVGGKNSVPMKALVELLEGLGLTAVRSYIQSGNVVFSSHAKDRQRLAAKIAAAMETRFGFAPKSMLLTREAFADAASANPYPEAEEDPKTLHLFFLESASKTLDHAALDRVKTKTERYARIGNVIYLHLPDGLGRSKLAAQVERAAGVPVTARNWRTVTAVLELAGGDDA